MTDRDRLVEILQKTKMIGSVHVLADALLAEGVTLPARPAEEPPVPTSFRDYLRREMPVETVIGNPDWWAPRLWRAALAANAMGANEATPQPAGPVTSEEAVVAYEKHFGGWFSDDKRMLRRHALDAALPLLARDHKYIALSEVERRAREWWYARDGRSYGIADLVSALTRTDGGGR